MKKVLAILLVVAMMAGVLPALTFTALAAEEPQLGLTATVWQTRGENNTNEVYHKIFGTAADRGSSLCSFDGTQRYDETIDRLKKASKVVDTQENAAFPGELGENNLDGFLFHWTGTMTSNTDATYWFAARKIDNGFVAVINDERKYEYWASDHWFDGGNDFLVSDKGSFELKANEPVAVDLWYLETNGGQALDVGVVTAADAARDTMQSLADAGITLNLKKDVWRTDILFGSGGHDKIKSAIPNWGVNNEGVEQQNSNGCPADKEQNHQYDVSIDAIKEVMTKLDGTIVRPNYEIPTNNLSDFREFGYIDNNFLVEYDGYVTPSISGTYEFGTAKVDNCLMVELTDEETGDTMRVYEFWAKGIWNDNSDTWSRQTFTLEAGKSYKIHVAFLEIDGGEAIESKIKINDEEYSMTTAGLTFTVEKPQGEVMPATVGFLNNAATTEWHYKTSGEGNKEQIRDNAWMTDPDVYGAWDTHTGRFTSDDQSWPTEKGVSDMESGKNHQSLWAVTEFTVDDPTAFEGYALAAHIDYDDNIRIYLNGHLLFIDTGYTHGTETRKLAANAKDVLIEGTNVLAVKLVQGWGGASFASDLYATKNDEGGDAQTFYNIGTPDELLAFATEANKRGNGTKNMTVNLTADIDMTDRNWTPIEKWVGKFYGNGHTISGLEYTAKADATSSSDGLPVGLMFTSITNNNANGRVYDLILEDCKLTVHATEGNDKGQQVIAGILAGMVDRGIVENVTVKGCTIDGNPGIAGGVAGVICWKADNKGNHVENCATLDSTITATHLAAGIVAYLRGGDNGDEKTEFTIGNMEVSGVNFVTEGQYSNGIGAKWGWGERDPHITSEEYENNTSKVTLGLDDGENYKFYSQTRKGSEDNTTDVRVVAVVKLEWLEAAAKANVKISFTNTEGSNTKSTGELSLQKVYQLLNAQNLSAQEMAYVAEEGIVILGWIITGVDNDYVNGLHVDMITQ